ncbi:MAG: hypothetical protein K6E99_04750 [Bacilli bacterium]|nr:hypothetical protein [Bacilli bacterium]
MIKTKLKVLFLFVIFAFALSVVSNTYSRYVAAAEENIDLALANWQILLNNEDITSSSSSVGLINPVILENENVANNKLAPSSKGYFDIDIDASSVELSFNYNLTINKNEILDDLIITKYKLIEEGTDPEEVEYIDVVNNEINGTFDYSEETTIKPFKIRVFFEWFDGDNETSDDESDTEVVKNNDTLTIDATIKFTQKLE